MRLSGKFGASISKSTFAEIVAGRKVGDPSLSIEIPKARGRVWVGTDTVLTESEETTTIPRRGNAFI